MKITHVILAGIILLAACSYSVSAARVNRQRPTFNWNMNTGTLSDQILNTMDSLANRNNRGNPNGRKYQTMPPEPPGVNLTVNDIIEQYPWIQNPTSTINGVTTPAGVASGSTASGTLSPPGPNRGADRRPQQAGPGKPKDGRTRFNNPRYLRDRLNGLNRDNYDFRVTQGVQIGDGKYKVKLNQVWRNLPVYGTSLVLEQENDTNLILESADGDFLSGIEEDIPSEVPSFNKDEAITRALEHNQDQLQLFQNAHAELMVDTIGDIALLAYRVNYFIPGHQLATTSTPIPTQPQIPSTTGTFPRWQSRSRRRRCRRRRVNGRRGCLPIESTVAAASSPPTTASSATEQTSPRFENVPNGARRPWVMMNAKTGRIYRSWDGLAAAIKPGPVSILLGNGIYGYKNYTEQMFKDSSGQNCYLQKPIGRGKFLAVNDLSVSNLASVHRFRCSDGVKSHYDQTNGAGSPRNAAFKWGSDAINFIKKASGTSWTFHVHIETHHYGHQATWNGVQIQLGDGDPVNMYPLTTPDIVTHELAHAFTEHNSGLEYEFMSGAINEAYSDMAAVAFIDYNFASLRSKAYRTGYAVLKRNSDPNYNKHVRDICNPRSRNSFQYDSTRPIITSALDYQRRQTDVHNASALYSKAFCELSKTPTWSIQHAFKVFTNANAIYWRPSETFNSAACGVKKAAYDFKNTNQAAIDVDNAFATVDIACDNSEWQTITPAPSL